MIRRGTVYSLAAAARGDAVRIDRIANGAVRGLCRELGVAEGDVVVCRAATPSTLLFETRTGRRVALERGWARFIRVESARDSAA